MDFVNTQIERLVPTVCHYDKYTVLTENADLMQTIEITGIEVADENFRKASLRNVIREVISENIKSAQYAVYIHTLNKKQDIRRKLDSKQGFARSLNSAWSEANNLANQVVCFLYITIVHIGKRNNFFNFDEIKNNLLFPVYKKNALATMEKHVESLTNVTNSILDKVERFGGRILCAFEKSGKIFSENLSFIARLIQISDKDVEVGEYSLAQPLSHNFSIKYGFNYLELLKFNPKRRYAVAAILTIKGVYELSEHACSLILEHFQGYLITESIFSANKNIATKDANNALPFFTACKGDELSTKIKLDDMLSGNEDEYNRRQTTIMLYGSDEDSLDLNVSAMCRKLNKIGVSFIREDFNLPKCFWSQIPGNSHYVSRYNYSKNNAIGNPNCT